MSRRPMTFRKRDVSAAIEAVISAGCIVSRVEIDRTGRIVIVTATASADAEPAIPLDAWLATQCTRD
jgi:hypothetical protein